MKKLIAALAFIPMLMISCADDDSAPVPENEPFFNLAVGKEWVYKQYYMAEIGTEYYEGVDTVRVTGTEVFNGNTYYTIEHTNDALFSATMRTCRVNAQGHLVDMGERVLHPGFDSEYQVTQPFEFDGETIGFLDFTSQSASSISVEGNNFSVIPFVGFFTSTQGAPEGEGVRYDYQQGIGLIRARCRAVNNLSYIEYRLVSYELN